MRISRRTMAAATAVAAGIAAVAFVMPKAFADVNLLANPRFESGSLSGWTCETGTAAVSGQALSASTWRTGSTRRSWRRHYGRCGREPART